MPENNNTQVQDAVEPNDTQQVTANTTGDNKPAENKEPEKHFTQAEVENIVKSRLDRERKGMPSKDELAAFKKWQEEQQTTEEKHANALKAAEQQKTDAEARASEFEMKYVAMTKGVKPDAVDDVIALAKAKVSDTTTLEQAIDGIIAKYPAFSGNVSQPPVTTGVKTNNNTVNTEDDVLLKKSMGLM